MEVGLPDSNMRPIWGRQDPGGPRVGPMNLAIWVSLANGGCIFTDSDCVVFVRIFFPFTTHGLKSAVWDELKDPGPLFTKR